MRKLEASRGSTYFFNALGLVLAAKILSGELDANKDEPIYQNLVAEFANHHPEFNPKTWENLKYWLSEYNHLKDLEAILAPPLLQLVCKNFILKGLNFLISKRGLGNQIQYILDSEDRAFGIKWHDLAETNFRHLDLLLDGKDSKIAFLTKLQGIVTKHKITTESIAKNPEILELVDKYVKMILEVTEISKLFNEGDAKYLMSLLFINSGDIEMIQGRVYSDWNANINSRLINFLGKKTEQLGVKSNLVKKNFNKEIKIPDPRSKSREAVPIRPTQTASDLVKTNSAAAPASTRTQSGPAAAPATTGLTQFKTIGDSACVFNPLAIGLAYEIRGGHIDKFSNEPAYQNLLNAFAEQHPNFQPKSWENLRSWLTFYNDKNDIEKILAPVLFRLHNKTLDKTDLKKNIRSELLYLLSNNKNAIKKGWGWDQLDIAKQIDPSTRTSCVNLDNLDLSSKNSLLAQVSAIIQKLDPTAWTEFKSMLETLQNKANGLECTPVRERKFSSLENMLSFLQRFPSSSSREIVLILKETQAHGHTKPLNLILSEMKKKDVFLKNLKNLINEVENFCITELDEISAILDNSPHLLDELAESIINSSQNFQKDFGLEGSVRDLMRNLHINPIVNDEADSKNFGIKLRLLNAGTHWSLKLNSDEALIVGLRSPELNDLTAGDIFNKSKLIPAPIKKTSAATSASAPAQAQDGNSISLSLELKLAEDEFGVTKIFLKGISDRKLREELETFLNDTKNSFESGKEEGSNYILVNFKLPGHHNHVPGCHPGYSLLRAIQKLGQILPEFLYKNNISFNFESIDNYIRLIKENLDNVILLQEFEFRADYQGLLRDDKSFDEERLKEEWENIGRALSSNKNEKEHANSKEAIKRPIANSAMAQNSVPAKPSADDHIASMKAMFGLGESAGKEAIKRPVDNSAMPQNSGPAKPSADDHIASMKAMFGLGATAPNDSSKDAIPDKVVPQAPVSMPAYYQQVSFPTQGVPVFQTIPYSMQGGPVFERPIPHGVPIFTPPSSIPVGYGYHSAPQVLAGYPSPTTPAMSFNEQGYSLPPPTNPAASDGPPLFPHYAQPYNPPSEYMNQTKGEVVQHLTRLLTELKEKRFWFGSASENKGKKMAALQLYINHLMDPLTVFNNIRELFDCRFPSTNEHNLLQVVKMAPGLKATETTADSEYNKFIADFGWSLGKSETEEILNSRSRRGSPTEEPSAPPMIPPLSSSAPQAWGQQPHFFGNRGTPPSHPNPENMPKNGY